MSSSIRFRLVGTAPLLMHSGTLSDPLDSATQALKTMTGMTKKTLADHRRISELEFHGSLYRGGDGAPTIPAENLSAVLIAGARKSKLGRSFASGTFVLNGAPLEYDGPTDPDALFKDPRFVFRVPAVVERKRLVRTRPIFRAWAAEFEVDYDSDQVNRKDIVAALKIAGERIGIGDWRPRFGRFTTQEVKAKREPVRAAA